jgi:hypothetical protein
MSDSRSTDVIARYTVKDDRTRVKGAGGLACMVFTAILGCAFWAGAVLASTPLAH